MKVKNAPFAPQLAGRSGPGHESYRMLRQLQFIFSRMALVLLFSQFALDAKAAILVDAQKKQVIMADAASNLVLRLNYAGKCVLDEVKVGGRDVIASDLGVCSSIADGGRRFTTRTNLSSPQLKTSGNQVTVRGIRFGGGFSEEWHFDVEDDRIIWRVNRTYSRDGTLEETGFPEWSFHDLSTWTGALLGDGGVAWFKLFDQPNAAYGVHDGRTVFWNKNEREGLSITAYSSTGGKVSTRFARQLDGVLTVDYCASEKERQPKHGLSRFRHKEQDVWQPFAVRHGQSSMTLTLAAFDRERAFRRGTFPGVDGAAVGEMARTIARIGVVDEDIIGSNGYYSDFAVLHEPWLAQLGLIIDDDGFFRNFAATIDYQREHAVGKDGRVKSRWCGSRGDAMPGTYDQYGFYECQWGWLMDSQTSWVINVEDEFDFNGDLEWLERQKPACEAALNYLLRRDAGNGLVTMMTDSEKQGKSSDWIDIVWASYKNALVNAQLYWALTRWTPLESLLNDPAKAVEYGEASARLQKAFNQSTSKGGFWDEAAQCYAYWLDKDGSVHGTNLVPPVNFSAIAYGLCADPVRRDVILDNMERRMDQEHLFFWPLCFTSYAPGEARASQYPFPNYENGDLFLGWGELGTRAYAALQPALALKYVNNVLHRYNEDGLAFQRYLRADQKGAGGDILANNCSIIVGLYRNLYGVQPKYNRLYLEPHLTPGLDGTELSYRLRGQTYKIELHKDRYAMAVDNFTVHDNGPFAVNTDGQILEYFHGADARSCMTIASPASAPIHLFIRAWAPERIWTETSPAHGATARTIIAELTPNHPYTLSRNGGAGEQLKSDEEGRLAVDCAFTNDSPQNFSLTAH